MPSNNHYRALAAQIAQQYGVPVPLFLGLVQAESAFNPGAVSSAGAIGLAQLMPGTAAALGVNPYDPEQNLRGGAKYLRQQLDRFGSVEKALAAYNAGPGAVERFGGVPPYTETQNYVQRVETLAGRIAGGGGLATPATASPSPASPGLFSLPFQPASPFFAPSIRQRDPEAIADLPEGADEFLSSVVNRQTGGRVSGIPDALGIPRAPGFLGRIGVPAVPEVPTIRWQPGFSGPEADLSRTPAQELATGPGELDPEAEAFEQRYLLDRLEQEGDLAAGRFAQEHGVGTGPSAPVPSEADFAGDSEFHLPGEGEVEKIPGWERYLRNLFGG